MIIQNIQKQHFSICHHDEKIHRGDNLRVIESLSINNKKYFFRNHFRSVFLPKDPPIFFINFSITQSIKNIPLFCLTADYITGEEFFLNSNICIMHCN